MNTAAKEYLSVDKRKIFLTKKSMTFSVAVRARSASIARLNNIVEELNDVESDVGFVFVSLAAKYATLSFQSIQNTIFCGDTRSL